MGMIAIQFGRKLAVRRNISRERFLQQNAVTGRDHKTGVLAMILGWRDDYRRFSRPRAR